jgi:hypothetical protein
MVYRLFNNSEVNIVFPPGTGGNLLCQIINDYLGMESDSYFPVRNNEWSLRPNRQIGLCHLHEFFKIRDQKVKVYTATRYREVLSYLEDKLTIIIHPDEYAGFVDCLALVKKWHREGGNTDIYLRNQRNQGYPNSICHLKQNQHYKHFSDLLTGEVINIDYSELFIKKQQSEWDLIARAVGISTLFPQHLENYHQDNIDLMLDIE